MAKINLGCDSVDENTPLPVTIVGGANITIQGGDASAANQVTQTSKLTSIDGKLPALSAGKVPVTDPTALPLPTGAATSAAQASLLSSVGEVQASPTANTLLDRVKQILTGIVLAAGTNLIGKVGIDQTTPGTSDSVTVKSAGHAAAVTITRPADTTAYTAGDAIGDTAGSAILVFNNLGKSSGGEVVITSVELEADVGALPSGMTSFSLRLYNSAPAAIADNAAWDLITDDRGKYIGKVTIPTPVDEGSTLFVDNDNINKQITLPAGTLYAVLQTNGAFTPTASAVKTIRIHTIEA